MITILECFTYGLLIILLCVACYFLGRFLARSERSEDKSEEIITRLNLITELLIREQMPGEADSSEDSDE